MARWHLDELRDALEHKGWRVVAELPGDDYRVSATWELQRSGDPRSLLIDFSGLDDLNVLPLDESYACSLRGTGCSLQFTRRGENGSAKRTRWHDELKAFVDSFNTEDSHQRHEIKEINRVTKYKF